eukprot:746676-Hanusia_phi.AAC.14
MPISLLRNPPHHQRCWPASNLLFCATTDKNAACETTHEAEEMRSFAAGFAHRMQGRAGIQHCGGSSWGACTR